MNETKHSRRNVLMAGASGVAAAILTQSARPLFAETSLTLPPIDRGKGLEPSFKLSLAAYSFRQHLDTPGKPGEMSLFDLAELCAQWGLDAFEPTSYYFLKNDDEFVFALKRKIFLLGLAISGMPVRDNFALPDGPEFDAQVEHVRTWIDIAAKLGAPTIRIFAGNPPKNGMSREDAFKQVVKGIRECCQCAGTKGVFLAIENHGYMTETAEAVLKIVEAVDHPWLGVNLDTGNFQEKPYEQIARLAPHAVVCQVKTLVAAPEAPNKKAPADYARIFQILREAKYRGYVALEYEGPNPRTVVPEEIRKLQAAARG
ncbi:MAG TPA: sugar phosphate isomerase/epimerase family protein [Phycisphaerae bacterium]|nr:sugar phosphate isomerase/epimerase family protein [Phycisphaerae bacterium]